MRKTPKCKNCGGYHYTYQCWKKPKPTIKKRVDLKKPKKVIKPTSLNRQAIIKKLDKFTSLYVRQKGADKNGIATCYTCGARYYWKDMDCGHYIKRRYLHTRWDLNNVRPQCLTRESRLYRNGKWVSISDIKEGNIVRAFNEKTLEPEYTKVLAVQTFMPSSLYEIELEDGSKFKATIDHKIVVNGKWYTIGELLNKTEDLEVMEIC